MFLTVKDVLLELNPYFSEGKILVSVAAGVKIKDLLVHNSSFSLEFLSLSHSLSVLSIVIMNFSYCHALSFSHQVESEVLRRVLLLQVLFMNYTAYRHATLSRIDKFINLLYQLI